MNLSTFLGSRLAGLLRFAMVLVNDRERAELLVEQAVLRVADDFPDGDDPDVLYAAGRVWVARGFLAQDMVLGNPAAHDVDVRRATPGEGAGLSERVEAVSRLARTVLILRYRELMPPVAIASTVGSTPDGILAYLDHVLDGLGVRHRRRAADAAPATYREDDLENMLDRHGAEVRPDVTAVKRTLSIALGYLTVDVPVGPARDSDTSEEPVSEPVPEEPAPEALPEPDVSVDTTSEQEADHADRVSTALALAEQLRLQREEAERAEAARVEAAQVEAQPVEAAEVEAPQPNAEPVRAEPDETTPEPEAAPPQDTASLDLAAHPPGAAPQEVPSIPEPAGSPPDGDAFAAVVESTALSTEWTATVVTSGAARHRRSAEEPPPETAADTEDPETARSAAAAVAGSVDWLDLTPKDSGAVATVNIEEWMRSATERLEQHQPDSSAAPGTDTPDAIEAERLETARVEALRLDEHRARLTDPDVQPDTSAPARPEPAESEAIEPEPARSELAESEAIEPEPADSEAIEPEPIEPEPIEPELAQQDAIEAERVAILSAEARRLEAHRAVLDRDEARRRAAERRAGERRQRSRRRSRRGAQQEVVSAPSDVAPPLAPVEPGNEPETQWLDLSVRDSAAPPRVPRASAPPLTVDEIDSILVEHLGLEAPAEPTTAPAGKPTAASTEPVDGTRPDAPSTEADLLDLTPMPPAGGPDAEPTAWVDISRRLSQSPAVPGHDARPDQAEPSKRRPTTPTTETTTPRDDLPSGDPAKRGAGAQGRRRSAMVLAALIVAVLAAVLALVVSRGGRTDAQGASNTTTAASPTPGSTSTTGGIARTVDRALPGSRLLESHAGMGSASVAIRYPTPASGRQLAIAASCDGRGPVQIGPVLLPTCTAPGLGGAVASKPAALTIAAPASTHWEFAVIDQPAADTNGSLIPAAAATTPPASDLLGDRTGTGTVAITLTGGSGTSAIRIAVTCRGAGVRLSSSGGGVDGSYTNTCFPGWVYQFDVPAVTFPATVTVAGRGSTSWHAVISRL